MEVLPINVAELVGVMLGLTTVLVPVLGLTLRFCVKPLIEAWGRAVAPQPDLRRELDRLERRVRELEEAQPSRALPARADEVSLTAEP